MSREAFDLMDVMTNAIASDDAMATILEHVARELDATGQVKLASTVGSVIREHRIRAMETRGRLAAISVTLGLVSGDEF